MNILSTSIKNQSLDQSGLTTPSSAQHHGLKAFFERNLKENFNFFTEVAQHFYIEQLNKRLSQISTQHGVFKLFGKSSEICGFVWGTSPEGGVGTIIWLVVDAAHQNQGIGKRLLDEVKTIYRSQNAHKIKLTVHQERAKNFYLREGFVEEGYHPSHWWGLSCWSMAYFL